MKRWEIYLDIIMELLVILAGALLLIFVLPKSIALSSDVLASAVSAYIYRKNKNLDIKNGMIMMVTVLLFTVVGSYIARFFAETPCMASFVVITGFTINLIPNNNVINTEKFPIVAAGRRLAI